MPGTLPVLNRKVVEYAVKAGLARIVALQALANWTGRITYPDLRAYQISQYDLPLCSGGIIK